MKNLIFAFIALGIFSSCQTTSITRIENPRPSIIASTAKKSSVMIVITINGKSDFGSGFFISPNQVVTNRHVISKAKDISEVKIYAKEGQRIYTIKTNIVAGNDDLVILETNETVNDYLTLGNSDLMHEGDEIFVSSNPRGYSQVFTTGIISSKNVENIFLGLKNDRVMLITAPISPGSSGGAVMNERGHVIGVVVATDNAAQNLNYIIPINCLKQMITAGYP
jgi:serine protease Do